MSLLLSLSLLALYISSITALPRPTPTTSLSSRQYVAGVSTPDFPGDIPSCVACQPEWSNISSCAAAAPAFENWMNVRRVGPRPRPQLLISYYPLTNALPLSFVDAIQCACTDTFGSAYPQCVDCFVQTNQCEQYLGVPSESNATSILDGVRQICGFGSALLGGVAASQTSAGLTYTYNGVPSQGYPTTTSIGVGGMDYGSAEGATSGAKTTRLGLVVVVAAVAGGALLVLGSV